VSRCYWIIKTQKPTFDSNSSAEIIQFNRDCVHFHFVMQRIKVKDGLYKVFRFNS